MTTLIRNIGLVICVGVQHRPLDASPLEIITVHNELEDSLAPETVWRILEKEKSRLLIGNRRRNCPYPIGVTKFTDFSHVRFINSLKPNDPYSGRIASLNSKSCILYIYSTNIGTEYFKHGIYSSFFPLQNAVFS